jgi:hypothetical protein
MFKTFLSIVSSGSLFALAAAAPSIGTVRSNGEFRVDGAAIRGNSTLFEGNIVESAKTRLVVKLAGAQVTLMPESRAKIYRDHTILEKGSGLMTGANHVVEASGLRIASSTKKDSLVQVEIPAPGKVAVAAQDGAEVRNSNGVLVASLRSGMALAFEPQSAASAVKVSGVVETKDGKFFLTDACANVRVELLGNLASQVGKRVEIGGSAVPGAVPVGGASQVIQVVTVQAVTGTPKPCGTPAGAAAAGGRAAAAGSASGAGLSTAATAAVIGGVAVGGTMIGLAAAGTFSDETPASR